MNQGPVLFLGLFIAMATSWYGMVVAPNRQLGSQGIVKVGAADQQYPTPRPGLAQLGADVYRANGCYYCHTEQIRIPGLDQNQHPIGADFERKWGKRQSVAQDYLYDSPVMLGQLRLGPDLANIGDTTLRPRDAQWLLLHLYDPKLVVPNSIMPRYPFLFEKRKINGRAHFQALALPTGRVEPGYEIVPKPDALALVAYLESLRADLPLPEAPLPKPPETPGANASTNAAAANTNAAPSMTNAAPAPTNAPAAATNRVGTAPVPK